MSEQIQAIVTVLSLMNPAICAAMFARAEAGRAFGEKVNDATRAGLAILVILSVAALIGTQLLHLFGVSLDAFMVAGGGGFLQDTLTRFMGLIVLYMGVQFALTGYHAFAQGVTGGG